MSASAYRVTNQPLLAIEVDGFAFHENNPDQRARDARKDTILDAHQMPLLRLPTTGSPRYSAVIGKTAFITPIGCRRRLAQLAAAQNVQWCSAA
jgi:hypothetical protein